MAQKNLKEDYKVEEEEQEKGEQVEEEMGRRREDGVDADSEIDWWPE